MWIILLWVIVGLLVAGGFFNYLYKKKQKDTEQRLKNYILSDESLKESYIQTRRQKSKSS